MRALKILFITLEFRTGTFSGNGVYATAQVRALAAAGHKVFVVSAAPVHVTAPQEDFDVSRIHEVPVSSWHRLDAGAPWREFAAGAAAAGLGRAIRDFTPDVVLAVDWSTLPAVRNLAPYCGGAPCVYLNYRVFSRTSVGPDLELIRGLEAAAMSESLLTVALSRSDAEYLAKYVAAPQGRAMEDCEAILPETDPPVKDLPWEANAQHQERQHPHPPDGFGSPGAVRLGCAAEERERSVRFPKVLLPALREDVRRLEPPADLFQVAEKVEVAGSCSTAHVVAAAAWHASRPYLSCVVRLSPEKEPERFVALVEAMAARGLLERHCLTPLLLGVASDEFAQNLKGRLRAAAPSSVILESFIGPAHLAELYRQTRLNIHPSTYDAYGMTIVEAASQGAPSVVHDGGGAVGATDLMRGAEGEVFLLDLTAPADELASSVSQVLEDLETLVGASVRAMRRARSWDEAANAAELVRLVREALGQCPAGDKA